MSEKQSHPLLLREEAREVERDFLEHEIHPDQEHLKPHTSAEIEEKGYDLQDAYHKIGGMGKFN